MPLLAAIGALGALWSPLALATVPLLLIVAALVGQAVTSASRSNFPPAPSPRWTRLRWLTLTSFLHFAQPFARLWGRLRAANAGYSKSTGRFAWPGSGNWMHWTEDWLEPMRRLEGLETALRKESGVVLRGGPHDRWDLEVRGGVFGTVRGGMAVEDHGSGTQFIRFRTNPQIATAPLCMLVGVSLLALFAGGDNAMGAASVLTTSSFAMMALGMISCARGKAAFTRALEETGLVGDANSG